MDDVKQCKRCGTPFWVTKNRIYCPDCSKIVRKSQEKDYSRKPAIAKWITREKEIVSHGADTVNFFEKHKF